MPREDRFADTLEVGNFSLITLGKCVCGWLILFGSLITRPSSSFDYSKVGVTLLPMFRGTGKSVTFSITFDPLRGFSYMPINS